MPATGGNLKPPRPASIGTAGSAPATSAAFSADGYVTITGRLRELIISGGFNVYPREVEEVLAQCPGVREVAVLGLPDPDLGERVTAAVVASDPALSAETVIAFCRERLAPYKKPREVAFRSALPRNALGKVEKHVLREQLIT